MLGAIGVFLAAQYFSARILLKLRGFTLSVRQGIAKLSALRKIAISLARVIIKNNKPRFLAQKLP